MKESTLILVILVLVVSMLVASCSGSAGSVSTDTAATENASGASLSLVNQLAMGILKLETTEQAVTVEQAQELLTLWQAYQALGNSETTAAVELEAVVNQIQAAMTTEQVEAIETMGLTSESIAEVMQEMGEQLGFGGIPGAEGTPEARGGVEGLQGGEMPEGGFPGGGSMPPGGGVPGAGGGGGMRMGGGMMEGGGLGEGLSLQGTPGAMGQNRFNSLGSQANPMLLRAVSTMLEQKIQASE